MKLFVVKIVTISLLLCGGIVPVVQAQTSAYRLIERDIAVNNKIQVKVTPGRATPISFSQTDETISYILLADPSRLVYTTDADLNSGKATTIF
jgi:spore germination protein YaaH